MKRNETMPEAHRYGSTPRPQAVIYLRVATEHSGDDVSITQQSNRIREIAKRWHISDTIADPFSESARRSDGGTA
jgi:hypothetical protein